MVETDLKRLSAMTGAPVDFAWLLGVLTQFRDIAPQAEDIERLDLPLKGTLKIPRGFKHSLEDWLKHDRDNFLDFEQKNLAHRCLEVWEDIDQAAFRKLESKWQIQEKKREDLKKLAETKPTKTNLAKLNSADRALEKTRMDFESWRQNMQKNDGYKQLNVLPDDASKAVFPLPSSVFQYSWAPLLVDVSGKGRLLRFYRYQVRPRGALEEPPSRFNMFNARLDSLAIRSTWRPLVGRQHGVIYLKGFYEWVPHPETKKPTMIRFSEEKGQVFWVPCLYESWSGKWSQGEFQIPSFAIITTDPPSEIALMGHDRCPIVPDQELLSSWLKPDRIDAVPLEFHKPASLYFTHHWAKP